jgi:hypothetical protein
MRAVFAACLPHLHQGAHRLAQTQQKQSKILRVSLILLRINKVIEEIKTAYERLSEAVEEMRNFLIDVESNKKIN